MKQDGSGDQLEAGTALQLVLFEFDPDPDPNRRRTNTVGIYDIAPRWVFPSYKSENGERVESRNDTPIQRDFEFHGKDYKLTLKPAFIQRKVREDQGADEGWVNVFPGEREQIVEEVIRRLATERGRLTLDRQDRVILRFSLYEVQKELERVNHTLNITEIKEALTILHQSFIEIRRKGKGGSAELSSTAFPTLAFRTRFQGDDEDRPSVNETQLQFNPLVADSIRSMNFRMISYRWLMGLKNPVSRWLYKRLVLRYESASAPTPTVMRASAIIRDSGMNEYSRPRDTLRAVRDTVMALKSAGIVESVEVEQVKEGRRLSDEIYTMFPSSTFLREVETALQIASHNAQELTKAAAAGAEAGDFLRLGGAEAATARRRRRTLLTDATASETAASGAAVAEAEENS
ncbi:plasmid replication protein [Azospirillum sp. SYSU D00513]|uniref:plasmid replication protein n=1 Tax=Azospirillum sp. SYSU D00513 TaxID=2812561 RepID=UPI001A97B69D|nr:plasmid replication protein [Azospirillum sp. SYSU D00513]